MKLGFWNKTLKSIKKKKWQIGASLVEYGLLVALIAVVAIPSVREMGWKVACKNALAATALSARVNGGFINATFGGGGACTFNFGDATISGLLTRLDNTYCKASWTSPSVQTWAFCFR